MAGINYGATLWVDNTTTLVAASFNNPAVIIRQWSSDHALGVVDRHTTAMVDGATLTAGTAASLVAATSNAQIDMMAKGIADIKGVSFTTAVPMSLNTALGYFTGGLTGGVIGGVPLTTASTNVWRDSNGFIPILAAGASTEGAKEGSAIGNGSNYTITINAVRYMRIAGSGAASYTSYAGGTLTMPAAHATLYRWDVVYLRGNSSGVPVPTVTQGATAASAGAAVVPDPPEDTFYVCHVLQQPAATAIFNYANVAGGAATFTAGQSYIWPIHQRATGTLPPDASIAARKILDFAPIAAVPPTKAVTVLAGQVVATGTLVNFAQTTFTYDAGGNYDGVHANPASPGANLARWDGLTINTSGQLIITTGATAATIGAATVPTLPTTNTAKAVGYVAAINGMTAVYPYQWSVNGTVPAGQGYILDTVRNSSGGASGGTTATFVNVVDDANSATYKDTTLATAAPGYVSPNLKSAISLSGTTVTITATANNPVIVATNGRMRTITASITATWGGGGTAGYRYLIADLSNSSTGFTAVVHSANDPSSASYQVTLATLWFDGSNLVAMDAAPIQNVDSTAVNLQRVQAWLPGTTGAITSVGAYIQITGGGNTMQTTPAIVVPPNCVVKLSGMVRSYVTYGAAQPVYAAVLMDGATIMSGTVKKSDHFAASGPWDFPILDAVLSGSGIGTYGTNSASIAPGSHTFTLGFQTTTGGGNINFYEAKLLVEISHAPAGILG